MGIVNRVFFGLGVLCLIWIAMGEETWEKGLFNFSMGAALLWVMYRHFQGMEEDSQKKDAEIKRLQDEQEELKRLIQEQEDAEYNH